MSRTRQRKSKSGGHDWYEKFMSDRERREKIADILTDAVVEWARKKKAELMEEPRKTESFRRLSGDFPANPKVLTLLKFSLLMEKTRWVLSMKTREKCVRNQGWMQDRLTISKRIGCNKCIHNLKGRGELAFLYPG